MIFLLHVCVFLPHSEDALSHELCKELKLLLFHACLKRKKTLILIIGNMHYSKVLF